MRQSMMMLLFLSFFPWQLSAESFQEGVHFTRLSSAQPGGGDKIEVIEFFWYGCPHCADFEPYMMEWKKHKPENVKLTLVPAIFREGWKVHAKAFYAAELLGVSDQIHTLMFDAMHRKKQQLSTPEQIAELFETAGIKPQQVMDTMNSFAVETKVRQAMQLLRDYKIRGVPAIAVNGKYLTGSSQAGSYPGLLQVIDYLVARENQS